MDFARGRDGDAEAGGGGVTGARDAAIFNDVFNWELVLNETPAETQIRVAAVVAYMLDLLIRGVAEDEAGVGAGGPGDAIVLATSAYLQGLTARFLPPEPTSSAADVPGWLRVVPKGGA